MDILDDNLPTITSDQLLVHLKAICAQGHFDEARRIVSQVVRGSPGTELAARLAFELARLLKDARHLGSPDLYRVAVAQGAGYWSAKALYELARESRVPQKKRLEMLVKVISLTGHGTFAAEAAAELGRDARRRRKLPEVTRWWRRWREILKRTVDARDDQGWEDLEALHQLADDAWMVGGDADQARIYAEELLVRATARKAPLYPGWARKIIRTVKRGVPFYMSLEVRRATKAGRDINSRASFDAERLYSMYDRGEHEAADRLADELIREHPGTEVAACAAHRRAEERWMRKDYDGAEADARTAISQGSPRHGPWAAWSLAGSFRRRKLDGQAADVLKLIVEQWPGCEVAGWAARHLSMLAPDEAESVRWREDRRKTLEGIAAEPDLFSDWDLQALDELISISWNLAGEARDADATRKYATQLMNQAIGRRYQGRHQERARRALAAVSKGTYTWMVPRKKK